MQQAVSYLESILLQYAPQLERISEAEFAMKPSPEKWSKKELLGHLVDSAHNNLRRFIAGQYEDAPQIVYAQDFWVKAVGYQQYDKKELVQLWLLVNKQICAVLKNMPAGAEQRNCITSEPHSIEWLAIDYNKHLLHHLHQLLNLEPVAYP